MNRRSFLSILAALLVPWKASESDWPGGWKPGYSPHLYAIMRERGRIMYNVNGLSCEWKVKIRSLENSQ